jgi:hypothetical protein
MAVEMRSQFFNNFSSSPGNISASPITLCVFSNFLGSFGKKDYFTAVGDRSSSQLGVGKTAQNYPESWVCDPKRTKSFPLVSIP